MAKTITAHVVSHTHWDRAWYWTFEQTRVRLVQLMDQLLALMRADAGYRHFVLDGQMAMVQDYLAIRPEQTATIRRMAREGRLLLGPFFVLPDLFIPSGESLVRNLRAGRDAAKPLGPVMKLGYLPDPFGHPAQLPQLLAGFGIKGMLFSRGLGDEADRLDADFFWDAPDGSRILATHQVQGYGNLEEFGQPPRHGREPRPPISAAQGAEWAVRRTRDLAQQMLPQCPSRHLLFNNGCDHLPPQPELPALIRAVNRSNLPVKLVHSTPVAYQRGVRRAIRDGRFRPRVHRGELRGGRYANLLPGVLSARVDLKLAHDACERMLLRWAEPWLAMAHALGCGTDDRALLDHAWRLLLQCQPHDDICGCSIDRVHEDDLNRMARAFEVGQDVRDRAMDAITRHSPVEDEPAWIAFNSSAWPMRRVVQIPSSRSVRGVATDSGPAPVQRTRDGLLALVHLPAHGLTPIRAGRQPGVLPIPPVTLQRRRGRTVLDNGLVRLELHPTTGKLRLRDLQSGLSHEIGLLDEGDAGDTYDFSPPAHQRAIRGPGRYALRILERGPLRCRVRLAASLTLPRSLGADWQRRSASTRSLPFQLELSLEAGSPRLDLRLTLINTVRDHRLRLTVQAPFPTDHLVAGAPFQVIQRALRPPSRPAWLQPPAAYQPFMDFVALEHEGRGIGVLAPGLREVEGRHRGRHTELGITLLRSVGWLSRDDLVTRTGEAGPCFEVEGALHRSQLLTYQVGLVPLLGAVEGDLSRHYAELAAPPCAIPVPTHPPRIGSKDFGIPLLWVEPADVQVTAVEPDPGAVVVRLVNLVSRTVTARVRGIFAHGQRLGLDGAAIGRVDLGRIRLRPCEIVTLRLTR